MKITYIRNILAAILMIVGIGLWSNANADNSNTKTKVKSYEQRRQEIREQLKRGSLKNLCAVDPSLLPSKNTIVAVITPESMIQPISEFNQGDAK